MPSGINSYVYHQQGSTKFVVASGGEVEVQSGGLVDAQSGSSHKVAGKHSIMSGGELEMQSGSKGDIQSGSTVTVNGNLDISGVISKESTGKSYVKGFTTHASTADGRLKNWGHSIIVAANSSLSKFRLDPPAVGIDKYVTVYTTVVTFVHATTASGGTSPRFGAGHTGTTNAHVVMKFKQGQKMGSAGNTVHLRGYSTSEWMVMNAPSTVGCIFSTST